MENNFFKSEHATGASETICHINDYNNNFSCKEIEKTSKINGIMERHTYKEAKRILDGRTNRQLCGK